MIESMRYAATLAMREAGEDKAREKQSKSGTGGRVMTHERQKAIDEWLSSHCQKCAENDDRGTGYVNCQAECEVQKDVGIACIHYDGYYEHEGKG
jgi:hypothetical protein